MEMMTVVRLDNAAASEHAIAGGKGAKLGQLTTAGFDVPPGFVVTTSAYRRFVKEAGLIDKIGQFIGSVNYDNFTELEAQTGYNGRLIRRGSFPSAYEGSSAP